MGLALEPRLHPVHHRRDAAGREVFPGMSDVGQVQAPGGPKGRIPVDAALLHRRGDAEHGLQLLRRRKVNPFRRPPHEGGELIQAAEDDVQVPREVRPDLVGWPEQPRRRPDQSHGAVGVGLCTGGRKDGSAAHAVAGKADLARIHEGLAAKVSQGGRPAKAGGSDITPRAAMPRHVHGQDHEAPPRQLDGEGALHLPGVDVAVAEEDSGGAPPGLKPWGAVDQARHDGSLGSPPAGLPNLDATRALHEEGQERPGDDQDGAQGGQPVAHAFPPESQWRRIGHLVN